MTTIGIHTFTIEPASNEFGARAQHRLDNLTKPLGSLGELETAIVRLAACTRQALPSIHAPHALIFAGDHGVTEMPVSAYGGEVTEEMAVNVCMGSAVSSVIARNQGIPLELIDVGVRTSVRHPRAIVRKVNAGTANFTHGPAMTYAEAIGAIEVGVERAEVAINQGCDLLIPGELGIGNTTSAAALAATLLQCAPADIVGQGSGVTDGQLAMKRWAIEAAIAINAPDDANPLDFLAKLGGFEIAAITGLCLAAAVHRTPVLLDGSIVSVAALIAVRLNAAVSDYLFASHLSPEPAHQYVLDALQLRPFIQAGMRLGEASGALLAVPLLQRACEIFAETATFEDARVSNPHADRTVASNSAMQLKTTAITSSPAHAGFDEAEQAALYKAILARRDIRVFLPDAIPPEVLDRILMAAHHGPSVGYMQPWNFILIDSKEVLTRIQQHVDHERVRAAKRYQNLKQDYYLRLKVEGLLQAPLTICVTNDTTRGGPHVLGRNTIPETDLMSTACAIENLWLAARVEGIAVGWVSMYEKQVIRDILGMPDYVDPVALLSLGYTTHFPDIPLLERVGWGERLNLSSLIYHNGWQRTEETES